MIKKNFLVLVASVALMSCNETRHPSETAKETADSSRTSIVQVAQAGVEEKANDLAARVRQDRAEKSRRDSVFAGNRQEVWVYQIGTGKDNPKDFERTYDRLTRSMQHLYFFKRSANDYYLILHDGYNSEQELLDEQAQLEKTLSEAGVKESVRVINITTYCSLKDKIKPADGVQLAKKEAICYCCD